MTMQPEDRTTWFPPVSGDEPPEHPTRGGENLEVPEEGSDKRSRDPGRSTRWILPTTTVALIGAGLVVLGAGVGTSYLGGDDSESEDLWAGVSVPSMPPSAGGMDPERAGPENVSVSELVDPEWVAGVSKASHISEQALAAYSGAALLANETFEGCNLGWNTLAAIGYVETEHGSYGGARIRGDGVVDPTILGPRLDGRDGVAEIRDTDGGEFDGDTEYDRAVGPMQFIPATWEDFAQNGSGDGEADINNIEDAAISAATYLCSYGDLSVEENWIDAIDAYNPSRDYNHEVADRADHYGNFG
ncbi:lytic murein transglycosylase [Actinomycetaceae bacterium L2_0104]